MTRRVRNLLPAQAGHTYPISARSDSSTDTNTAKHSLLVRTHQPRGELRLLLLRSDSITSTPGSQPSSLTTPSIIRPFSCTVLPVLSSITTVCVPTHYPIPNSFKQQGLNTRFQLDALDPRQRRAQHRYPATSTPGLPTAFMFRGCACYQEIRSQ